MLPYQSYFTASGAFFWCLCLIDRVEDILVLHMLHLDVSIIYVF